MDPTPEALAAHSFEYDASALDKPLAGFLQRFYTFSDDRENADAWAACFSEDGIMKKAATNVQGRIKISEVNQNSWKGQSSRKHTVFKVFPFSPGNADEVMLYGQSNYVYDDGTTGEMGWAARLHFQRFDDGKILIDMYHIFPPHINLQGGWPTPRLHPVEALESASASLFRQKDINKQLLYGPELGSGSLRESIGRWLNDFYAPSAGSIPSERILITNGASNGLATILQKFTDPTTRAVWMVEPTYFLACPIFRDAGLMGRIRGAPEGEDGVDLKFLTKALQEIDDSWPSDAPLPPRKLTKAGYPKIYKHIIYLIPTFSNPSGKTMSTENRKKLVQLARKHDALIVTDDVYDMLSWSADDEGRMTSGGVSQCPPRIVDIDRDMEGVTAFGNSMSNGSFSKIVAPGMRVGWLEGTPDFIAAMGTVGASVSGGCQGHFASLVIDQMLQSGVMVKHINETLIPVYRERYFALTSAIKNFLYPLGVKLVGEKSSVTVAGGFFLYVSFGEYSGEEIARVALEEFNLKIAPGSIFAVPDDPLSANRGKSSYFNGARLCWAWHEKEEIVEGIERLAAAIRRIKETV
ncbi:aminotransferase [Colletotrichum karsti]|uniref:Aminotransferase n=1 Tax=Colletotrichum karsti TaxID=1095194 RepID=A0A9P6LFK8_9PEZI|nr:aminotransferase [Colletotrichum karsti]KAF9871276.1 aminotransferase [Colletotrichum karsti]